MQTRKLGNTDIDVSLICLGTMTWGEQNTEQEAFEQLDYATGAGINFIDAAEMYPVPPRAETQGLTETYLGNWLASRGKR
ncbi:MAG TPA: aldo/keto reductase, partial [Marinobacter sp.]|nr:aldo/keto reductase [Marinobacter sp.]